MALQALCLFDALGPSFDEEVGAFLQDSVNYVDLGWHGRPRAKLVRLARGLVTGARANRERYDQLLRDAVPGWSLERMQPVDRNILRLGLYELLEVPDTPFQVVLNEAIELARLFGGTESSAFVNGVLDGVRRRLDGFATPADGTSREVTDV